MGLLVGRIVAAVHGLRGWRVFAACVFGARFAQFFFSLKEKWMILTKLNEADKVWCQRFFFWAFGWSDYRSRAWVAGVAGLLLHVSLAHVSHSLFFVERKMSDFDKAQ